MKYALLNNERIEPQTGIKDAICPCCKEPVIPKCGSVKIHHWAHKNNSNCDPWWENETEWHRQWKDNFSKECQEIIHHDKITGEKHVADVKTKTGIVIEFQHSNISEEEKYSREQFYKNMVWVVDASKYYDKFKRNIKRLQHCSNEKSKYFYTEIDTFEEQKNCFNKKWLTSDVPVIFDFGIHNITNDDEDIQKKWLWCIFPQNYIKNLGYNFDNILCGMCLKREHFINTVSIFNNFYKNIEISEFEELKIKFEQKELEYHREWEEEVKAGEELIKQQKEELFKTKYPKEEKWRDAIFQVKLNIRKHKLNPIKLYISNNGEILDTDKNKYNNKKYMILGVKSYPAEYNGKSYTKNDVLLLIQTEHEIITAIINVPSYILKGSGWYDSYGLLDGNYNYYIRTMTTIPHYNKYALWSEGDDMIWTTKSLKENLKYIETEFSNYKL